MTPDLTQAELDALRTGKGERETLNKLCERGYAYWVPTTWLTPGGYFLNERGKQARGMLTAKTP